MFGINISDPPPTPRERELWAKAVESPHQLTEEEKLLVLEKADRATQIANAFQVSGLTPEELEEKALTQPVTLSYAECRFIKKGYYIKTATQQVPKRKAG